MFFPLIFVEKQIPKLSRIQFGLHILFIYLLSFIAILVTNTACIGSEINSNGVRLNGRILLINGTLTGDMYRTLSNIQYGKFSEVQITSLGGDAISSIYIARFLKNSGKYIHIKDICMSACINIAVIDKNIIIDNDTMLVAHQTLHSQYEMYGNYSSDVAKKISSIYNLESNWYQENGISNKMLLIPSVMMNISCVRLLNVSESGGGLSYHSKYVGWAITPESAKYYGMKAVGNWIGSQDQALKSFLARHPKSQVQGVNFSSPPGEIRQKSLEQLKSILKYPLCTD